MNITLDPTEGCFNYKTSSGYCPYNLGNEFGEGCDWFDNFNFRTGTGWGIGCSDGAGGMYGNGKSISNFTMNIEFNK